MCVELAPKKTTSGRVQVEASFLGEREHDSGSERLARAAGEHPCLGRHEGGIFAVGPAGSGRMQRAVGHHDGGRSAGKAVGGAQAVEGGLQRRLDGWCGRGAAPSITPVASNTATPSACSDPQRRLTEMSRLVPTTKRVADLTTTLYGPSHQGDGPEPKMRTDST